MKTFGRVLWLVCLVAIAVLVVAFNHDKLFAWFSRLSLIAKILAGLGLWLASAFIPYMAFLYVTDRPEEEVVWSFLILWPPLWPITVFLWLLRKLQLRR